MHEAVLKKKEVSSSVLSLTFEWNHEMDGSMDQYSNIKCHLAIRHSCSSGTCIYFASFPSLSHTHSAETPLPGRHMKRYPKRVNDRKQYQEDELSDEDEYLCKEWQNEFHGYKKII